MAELLDALQKNCTHKLGHGKLREQFQSCIDQFVEAQKNGYTFTQCFNAAKEKNLFDGSKQRFHQLWKELVVPKLKDVEPLELQNLRLKQENENLRRELEKYKNQCQNNKEKEISNSQNIVQKDNSTYKPIGSGLMKDKIDKGGKSDGSTHGEWNDNKANKLIFGI